MKTLANGDKPMAVKTVIPGAERKKELLERVANGQVVQSGTPALRQSGDRGRG